MTRQFTLLLAAATLAGTAWLSPSAAQTTSQTGPAPQDYQTVQGAHTLNPGDWPAHYPFADDSEAAIAAPEVHHVRYVDAHVRLVEVAYFPGVVGNMHGHPYPSVFAVDSPVPKGTNTPLDRDHNMVAVVAPAPEGAAYPFCRAASPQNPHHESNLDSYPHHFYRLEFLPMAGGDHTIAPGPDGTRLLYEDDHLRLVEVLIRPGETRRIAANPYPSVMASDAAITPLPHGGNGHESAPLAGFDHLKCATSGAATASAVHNASATPIHYYRFDFKRIDGDGIKDHWREWYPWMATLKDAWDRSPNVPNF